MQVTKDLRYQEVVAAVHMVKLELFEVGIGETVV